MVKNNIWQVSKFIAHRGASAVTPENTIASLTKAYEIGAQWVEADVRLTLDGEAIIFHDSTLERCTNGRGSVRRTPFAVIAELDAGSWFSAQYAGEKIPTLNQWLQTAASLGCGIILDLKCTRFEIKRLVDHVAASLARFWKADLPRPILSSDSAACLKALYMQKLDWDLAYIMKQEHRNWKKVVDSYECLSIHLDHQFISERWLKQLIEKKIHLAAYTVNDLLRAQQLFDWGVESVFTDDPRLFL